MMLNRNVFEQLERLPSDMERPCFKIRNKVDNQIYTWQMVPIADSDDETKDKIERQIGILSELKHENITEFHGFTLEFLDTYWRAYIITEYCEGGSLAQLIEETTINSCNFSECFVWAVLYQLLLALEECHSLKSQGNVLHRNLKPSTVYFTADLTVKLGDFTHSRQLYQFARAGTITGVPTYRAPELFQHQPYDEKCDMWALGCIIYEMCQLTPPFGARNECELARKVIHEKCPELRPGYSNHLEGFIDLLLQKDPMRRPSARMLKKKINALAYKKVAGVTDGNGSIHLHPVVLPIDHRGQGLADSMNRKVKKELLRVRV